MSDFVKVGSKADFPAGRTTGVKVNDKEVCVANTGSEIYAFHDQCTHAQAGLSGCPIEDGMVACPLHGAQFDVKTGDAKSLPATEAVPVYAVKVEGNDVYVKL